LAAVAQVEERFTSDEAAGQLTVTWQRFHKHRFGVVALVILGLLVLSTIIVPIFSPFDQGVMYPDIRLAPIGTVNPNTGHTHLLGTDTNGRDIWTRLFYAGRISLIIALLSAASVVVVGSIIGAVAGFYGGWVDMVFMRLADFMLALPILPMYLIVIRFLRLTLSGDNLLFAEDTAGIMLTLIIIFTLFGWMGISRLVRSSILSLRSQPFVEAATALGASNRRIIFRHLLPNSLAPVLVAATFVVGDFIILESILSYFGQGILEPPSTSWGIMIANGQQYVLRVTNINPFEDIRAYLAILPGAMILLTTLCVNYIGDALRDALDPQMGS